VEALACGTPVVGLRYGSVPEIVRAGVTGYVVADDAAVLENLTTVVESARSLVPPDCRLDAEARFDRRVMAQNYLAQYEAVLAGETW
jgi:glycosyltransferase involved in cell wall biosynthesis